MRVYAGCRILLHNVPTYVYRSEIGSSTNFRRVYSVYITDLLVNLKIRIWCFNVFRCEKAMVNETLLIAIGY